MSGPPGPGGLWGGKSAEDAFRDNLRTTAAGWLDRLRASPALGRECVAIGTEASELKGIAQLRGWGATAKHLHYVERRSKEGPGALIEAIDSLGRALLPADLAGVAGPGAPPWTTARVDAPQPLGRGRQPGPSPPGSIAPPPLLNSSSAAPAGATPGAVHGRVHEPPLVAPPSPAGAGRPSSEPERPKANARVPQSRGLPDSVARPAAPKLLVRTVLGFRAFGRKANANESAAPATAPSEKPLLGLGKLASESPGAPRRRVSSTPGQGPAEYFAARASARPPALSPVPAPWGARRQRSSKAPPNRPSRSTGSTVPRWFYALAAIAALFAISIVVVVLVQHGTAPPAPPSAVVERSSAAAATAVAPLDSATPVVRGPGTESPELRALIEAQIRLVANCRADATKCRGWTPYSQAALNPFDAGSFVPARPDGRLSAWLQRLKVPRDFPLNDNPTVKGIFEYNSKNISGRAQFQQKYFNCSAFDDIFDSTLIKYGAPTWLKAVVYQESGCDVVATSPAGARGLWQFMPESARAYGLRVQEDDVDERLDPAKATDAAIHFLTDLWHDLGAWDLALAGYNMGPFGVIARVMQVGEGASFWDLSKAGLLPDETAGYVPAIEAYALILENLRGLNLGGAGKHPQSTAEINVKAGTRLSFVARAAHTSSLHIRELNRAYLRDVVPEGETTVWVPDSEAHRAQVFLDTPAPDDKTDMCVPEDFDWGTTVLETSKYAKKCAHGAPSP
jgi:hypothetical protein